MTTKHNYTEKDYECFAKHMEEKRDGNSDLSQLKQKNDEAYIQCEKTWKMFDEMKNIEQFDTNMAWDKLHNKLEEEDLLKQTKVKTFTFKSMLSVAASLVLLLGLAFLARQFIVTGNHEISNVNASAKIVNLPDGSVVYLNKDASISFADKFNGETREIELNGEAFFDIKRNTEKPFVVNINGAQVKVLGTSFNVKPTSEDKLEVTVKTGRVQLCDCASTGANVILTPGEKGVLSMHEISKIQNEDLNYLAWKNKKLSFKSSPLYEVVNDINSSYHANIEINDDEIKEMLITTTFDSLSINEILESLSLTLNIKIEQDGKNIILVNP